MLSLSCFYLAHDLTWLCAFVVFYECEGGCRRESLFGKVRECEYCANIQNLQKWSQSQRNCWAKPAGVGVLSETL